MAEVQQFELFELSDFDSGNKKKVKNYLYNVVQQFRQPSGIELLKEIEDQFGWQVRWYICYVIREIIYENKVSEIEWSYFKELLNPVRK